MMQDEGKTRKQLKLNPDEEILYIERMSEYRSAINFVIGRLIITNQRIVFLQKRNNAFGLIGLALGMGKVVLILDEPKTIVKGWTQGSHGPNKRVLDLNIGKEKPMRFMLNRKYELVDEDFKQLLAK
jgi:hypothetical protein